MFWKNVPKMFQGSGDLRSVPILDKSVSRCQICKVFYNSMEKV